MRRRLCFVAVSSLLGGLLEVSALVSPPTLRRPVVMNAMYRRLGESTRYTVSTAVATALIVRHDAATLRWVVGAVAASAANKGLKKVIKEARPGSGENDGMPSSHACAMANLGTSVVTNTWLHGTPWWCPLSPAAVAAAFLGYFLVSVSWRVTARYHTVPQIVVGAAFGCGTSFAWRWVWDLLGATAKLDGIFATGALPVVAVVGALVAGAVVVLGYDDLRTLLRRGENQDRGP
mmetsp:Transcript_27607/g.89187  ORF Transcript_27607/g.89187 Transcript_27607/m.89187 type:complete len:234 (+) Transcript_27607:119-820(+)